MKTLVRAGALSLLLATTVAAPAALAQAAPPAADSMFRATTLNLSAYGEVRQRPDQATISLGVTTEAPTAAEAMRLITCGCATASRTAAPSRSCAACGSPGRMRPWVCARCSGRHHRT